MVVEDDPDNLDSIVDVLVEEGYEVVAARSGHEAREHLGPGGADPCLVIADYLLPDMTGSDLLRLVKAERPERPVPMVILTAASNPSMENLDAPVLRKPVTIDDLLGLLRRYCDLGAPPGAP